MKADMVDEFSLQRAIMAAIGALQGVCVHRNNVGTARYDSGARVEYGVGGKGAPDLVAEVLTPSGAWACVWMEVKTAAGVLSREQKQWHAAAEKMGRHVYVIRSVEQAEAVVQAFRTGEGCEAVSTQKSNAGTWRVICEDGKTHTMEVHRLTDDAFAPSSGYVWNADCSEVGGTSLGRTPREAVQSIVRMAFWTPLEILAPNEKTREEAIAGAVKAEQEACAKVSERCAAEHLAADVRAGAWAAMALNHAAREIRARST